MNEDEFSELAAGHALHALTDAERARFEEALRAHPEWASIAETAAETASILAEAAPAVAPPPMVREALLSVLAETPQEAGSSSHEQAPAPAALRASSDEGPEAAVPARRRPLRVLFALAACLVVLIGLGVGGTALLTSLTTPASVVALDEIESAQDAQQTTVELDSGATATAHWSASVGRVVLVAEGLESLEQDQSYELWFVRGDTPVSAGIFQADESSTTVLLEGEMQAGDAIAVTVEAAGGSPSGAPTTEPILVIPTA